MSFQIDPETLKFELPSSLIAQEPARVRTQANLMVLDRLQASIAHKEFSHLGQFLNKTDVLVLNKTKVNRAKFFGRKKTGGRVEIIFIDEAKETGLWRALIRPQLDLGSRFNISPTCEMLVKDRLPTGEFMVYGEGPELSTVIREKGLMPLPPYIKRSENDPRNLKDVEDYQTVFAEVPGSIAAPTAALHFSEEFLAGLKSYGIEIIPIVLHVGWGTFKPVAGSINAHQMLPEKFEIEMDNLKKLYAMKNEGCRIVAVGTTVARVLENLPDDISRAPLSGETSLFIRPGFKFRWLGGLLTNFHVPRSTPIALAAAFSGLDFLTRAYAEAIQKEYRFFSYGDAMLIL